jgi:hypothetical protein
MASWGQVSAPVIFGTAAGGFTFAYVRRIVKPFMNWRDTTPMPSDAGARLLAPVRRADWLPGRSSLDSATTASELDEGVALVPSDDEGGRRFPRPARIRSDRVKSRFGENRVRSPLIDHFPQAPVAHSAGVQLLLRDAAPSLPAQVNPELTCSLDGHFQSSVSARMLSWVMRSKIFGGVYAPAPGAVGGLAGSAECWKSQ